jgi:hypothetical protein
MKIYVGLSRPKSSFKFLALLIRWSETPKSILEPSTWFQVYKASHVFLAYPAHPKRGFFMVNEAVGVGVRWVAEGFFLDHASIQGLYLFDLPENVYRAVKNYGDLMSGAPYPLLENVGIGVQRVVKWLTRKDIANPFDNNASAIKCSELFFRALFNAEESLSLVKVKEDLLNEKGEYISADEDSLGVRDSELVLEWLVERGYCKRVSAIEPVQNSSGLTGAA